MMVAGVAHEINTPLGVAKTAMSCLVPIKEKIIRKEALDEDDLEDLEESISLTVRNVDRAANLVQNFKKLSVNQLTDDLRECNIKDIVVECLEVMKGELKRAQVATTIESPDQV